jgi:hypothetical protein
MSYSEWKKLYFGALSRSLMIFERFRLVLQSLGLQNSQFSRNRSESPMNRSPVGFSIPFPLVFCGLFLCFKCSSRSHAAADVSADCAGDSRANGGNDRRLPEILLID